MVDVEACWYEDEQWRGWVPMELQAALLARHVFASFVAGVSHHVDAAQDSSFAPGSRLQVIDEPSNPVDPMAVAIWNADRTLQAGYLPRFTAHSLSAVPGGRRGLVISEQLAGGRRAGIGILVSREDVTIREAADCEGRAYRVGGIVRRSKADAKKAADRATPPPYSGFDFQT